MTHPYELPHLLRNKSLRRAHGLPVEKNKSTMPFPAIYTSLAFSNKAIKDDLGADSFELNQIAATMSRININMLLKIKQNLLSMETFKPYLNNNDHPYLTALKALTVTLMIGRLKTESEINVVLTKLNKVALPFITNITRTQSPYMITSSMAHAAYYKVLGLRSSTIKPSSPLGSNETQQSVVTDIADFLRLLVYELRLAKGMLI